MYRILKNSILAIFLLSQFITPIVAADNILLVKTPEDFKIAFECDLDIFKTMIEKGNDVRDKLIMPRGITKTIMINNLRLEEESVITIPHGSTLNFVSNGDIADASFYGTIIVENGATLIIGNNKKGARMLFGNLGTIIVKSGGTLKYADSMCWPRSGYSVPYGKLVLDEGARLSILQDMINDRYVKNNEFPFNLPTVVKGKREEPSREYFTAGEYIYVPEAPRDSKHPIYFAKGTSDANKYRKPVARITSVYDSASRRKDDYKYKFPNDIDAQHLEAINRERSAQRRAPLSMSRILNNAAAIRAEEISRMFSHTRPNGGDPASSAKEVYPNYRWNYIGENILMGTIKNVANAMNSWMNSVGHRDNILHKNYKRVGVATYIASNGDWYWVQLFSDKAPDEPYFGGEGAMPNR